MLFRDMDKSVEGGPHRAVSGEILFCSPRAAVTKYPALTVSLEPRHYSPGGWESEIKVSAKSYSVWKC